MTKLNDREVEQAIIQAHADVLAVVDTKHGVDTRDADRGIVRALRSVYTIGRDQGTAETIERAVALLGSPVGDVQTEQLARSVALIMRWCDAGDESLECRSYNVRRTAFSDAERKYAATGSSIGNAYPVAHFGASYPEALARLATWCAERLTPATASECCGVQLGHVFTAIKESVFLGIDENGSIILGEPVRS